MGKVGNDIVAPCTWMSTEFALQNGRIIEHLRTYTLRCYTCFNTASITSEVFCPNCGNKTLKRVALSLYENGKQVIHINTRRPFTTKYRNQPLPIATVFCLNINTFRHRCLHTAKTKANALDDDYIASYSPFVMRDVDSKSAMLRQKGYIKEWARNNIYENGLKNVNRYFS